MVAKIRGLSCINYNVQTGQPMSRILVNININLLTCAVTASTVYIERNLTINAMNFVCYV